MLGGGRGVGVRVGLVVPGGGEEGRGVSGADWSERDALQRKG